MRLPIYQVDAFTCELFGGNPAAVVPLASWLADEMLAAIARENNLAETAYIVPLIGDDAAHFHLRWFTPEIEVPLCGHATLATAHVLRTELGFEGPSVSFRCASGIVGVDYGASGSLTLDFPAIGAVRIDSSAALGAALGREPGAVFRAVVRGCTPADLMAVFESEAEVRALAPDFRALKGVEDGCVIATAPSGDGVDFVSRFFAPGAGIDEDPVTGSAHCMLTVYWAERLDRHELEARQVSSRGGALRCELAGDRVRMSGNAVTYLRGEIDI